MGSVTASCIAGSCCLDPGSPFTSATPPQATEILDYGGISSATKTSGVADKNGSKPAENLNCGGAADQKWGLGRKRYDVLNETDL
jgi:hypothetical protein